MKISELRDQNPSLYNELMSKLNTFERVNNFEDGYHLRKMFGNNRYVFLATRHNDFYGSESHNSSWDIEVRKVCFGIRSGVCGKTADWTLSRVLYTSVNGYEYERRVATKKEVRAILENILKTLNA